MKKVLIICMALTLLLFSGIVSAETVTPGYSYLGLTSSQSNPNVGDTVQLVEKVGNLTVSGNKVTLEAGKTYELDAQLELVFSTAYRAVIGWRDFTNGVNIGVGAYQTSDNFSSYTSHGNNITATITPETDIEVGLYVQVENYLTSITTRSFARVTEVMSVDIPEVPEVPTFTEPYDSGWFSTSANVEYTKTHNLGDDTMIVVCYGATDSSGTGMSTIDTLAGEGGGADVYDINDTTFKYSYGTNSRIRGKNRTSFSYSRIIAKLAE